MPCQALGALLSRAADAAVAAAEAIEEQLMPSAGRAFAAMSAQGVSVGALTVGAQATGGFFAVVPGDAAQAVQGARAALDEVPLEAMVRLFDGATALLRADLGDIFGPLEARRRGVKEGVKEGGHEGVKEGCARRQHAHRACNHRGTGHGRFSRHRARQQQGRAPCSGRLCDR
jgi:hypothetical protein